MLETAAQATNGVQIPSRRVAREAIMDMFHEQMSRLKADLTVSMILYDKLLILSDSSVQSGGRKGIINLTCDAWQSKNVDGYLAVTAHWIHEEGKDQTKWTLRSAIIGFTKLNNSHHGKRLGQALFKVTERLGITRWVRSIVLRLTRITLS